MDARSAALFAKTWPRQLVFLVFIAAVLFAPAGTLRYWQAWAFLVMFVACTLVVGAYFVVHDPALVERRLKVGPTAEREPAQRLIVSLLLLGLLAMLIVPGFDRRWHWSDVPAWLSILADAGIAASFVLFFFVMKQNSYAAATIRVEGEQKLISTGLYGVVRHPMYMATLPLMIAIPLALGSVWALLLLVPLVPVLMWRTLDEERVLAAGLPGYRDYCARVRYRLVPGVW